MAALPDYNSPAQVVALSAQRYWIQTEDERVSLAQRLWNWYYNDEDKIIDYILYGYVSTDPSETVQVGFGGLSKIFPKTYLNMSVKVLNIVPRVVDKLAFVYKNSPQRMLNGDKQSEVIDGEVKPIENKDDDRFQELLKKSTIEKKQGAWNALGKLFNTVLVQPVWIEDEKDKSKSYMDFLIHAPAWCAVETSKKDWLKAKSFRYNAWLKIADGQLEEQVTVYWSDTEHYVIDSGDNKKGLENNPDKKNPYGILPAVILRFRDGIDFWGEGMWDLVNANQEICEQVTNLCYVAKTQAHGQMVILDPSGSIEGNILTGVDHPIHISNFENGQSPDVKYINANAALKPVQDLIDWQIKTAQMLKGLSPQQYSLDSSIASGASKMVDATEIEEIRKNDMNVITMFESDLFDVMRTVYNYHNQSNQISKDAKFSVKFPEPKINETQNDKNARMKFDLDNHLTSILRLIKEKNPGMSDDDAQKEFDRIIAEGRMIKDELGLNDLFNSENMNEKEDDEDNNLSNNLP